MSDDAFAKRMAAEFQEKPGGHLYAELFRIIEGHGLEPHGASNSKTLLFKLAGANGEKHNVLAFRREPIRVLSFPKSYGWSGSGSASSSAEPSIP